MFDDFDDKALTQSLVVNLDAIRNLDRAVELCLGPIPWERADYQWNEISPSDFFIFAYLAVFVDFHKGVETEKRLLELRPHYQQWLKNGYIGGVLNLEFPLVGQTLKERFELVDGFIVPAFTEALWVRCTRFLDSFHGELEAPEMYNQLWNATEKLPLLELLCISFIAEVYCKRDDGYPYFLDTQLDKWEIYKPTAGRFAEKVQNHWHRFDETSDEFTEDESSDN